MDHIWTPPEASVRARRPLIPCAPLATTIDTPASVPPRSSLTIPRNDPLVWARDTAGASAMNAIHTSACAHCARLMRSKLPSMAAILHSPHPARPFSGPCEATRDRLGVDAPAPGQLIY